MMEEKKYPCRTEKISGTTYIIKMYLGDSLRMTGSRESKEEADRHVKSMSEKLPQYRFEITESPWTNEVCVECGREEY
jgi:hypothetical protein